MEYRSVYWEDVEEGQALPSFTYELSLMRLVAMVRASGLYDYVHFDRDYAQAAGARDAFMATHHVGGLFSRLLTDWSGPEADLRSLTFNINTQSCPNDILTLTGKVGRKYVSDQGEYLVDLVDLNMSHQTAAHAATASATMALPSRVGGPVKVTRHLANRPSVTPDPNMPDFAKSMLGKVKEGVREPAWPLTVEEIHQWCECLEDWNPLYWDKAFAAKSRHGGIIAPAPAWFFGTGFNASMGIGYMKPGETIPEEVKKGLTGIPLLQPLREKLIARVTPFLIPGCPEIALAQFRGDYFTRLHPGDTAHAKLELLNCTPKKRTKLGEGHFVTWGNSLYNQREELVRNLTMTALFYHV